MKTWLLHVLSLSDPHRLSLHVASYFLQTKLQPDLPALFRRAHSPWLTTSLDTNYDPSEKWIGFNELLSATDIFLPTKTEALSIAHSDDIESAAKQPADKRQTILIPSFPVSIVDTSGAGDTFDAGFLYGYLNDWDLEKSLQCGAACIDSRCKPQGTTAQPTLDQVLAFVK